MNKDVLIFSDELKNISSLKLPDPSLLDFYRRKQDRIIWWNNDVTDDLIEETYSIIMWNKEDKDIPVDERIPIKIFINSNGGDLLAVKSFMDVVELSKTPVYTIGLGKLFSAGGIMLIGGHKGKRCILPSACALIHDGSDGYVGNVGKMQNYADFGKKLEVKVEEYILKNTKIPRELYKEKWREDWWFMPEEIIEYGLADFIITDLSEIL